MTKSERAESGGSVEVRLTDDQIILVVLAGHLTGDLIREVVSKVQHLVELLKHKQQPVLVLSNIKGVSGNTSEARSLGKQMSNDDVDKTAIVGGSRLLNMVGQYVVQASHSKTPTKFFRTEWQAKEWLKKKTPKRTHSRTIALQLSAIIIALIGAAPLLGWWLNNRVLIEIHQQFRPTNPMTAVGLIMAACAITLLIQFRKSSKLRRYGVAVVAGWFVAYGVLVLIRYWLHTDTRVDALLFADKLATLGSVDARTVPRVALIFINIGSLFLLALSDLKHKWQNYAFQVFTAIALLSTLVTFTGYGFGFINVDRLTGFLPVPINAAFGVPLIVLTLVGVVYRPDLFPLARRFLRVYGRGLVVFALVALITGLAWQQTKDSIEQSKQTLAQQEFDKTAGAIEGRISSYQDALRGFKAFVEGSTFVTPDEFDSFFTRSGLQQHYPGFNSISFIRRVPASRKAAFEAEIRTQAGSPAYKNFTVQTTSNLPDLYAVTYTAPRTSTTTYGTDLGTLPDRLRIFETARDSGQPAASDVVTFAATATVPATQGFIISMPVYTPGMPESVTVQERRQNLYGYVNAVFRNNVLFSDIFKSLKVDRDAAFTITDTDEAAVLYESSSQTVASQPILLSRSIDVAGQSWSIAMHTNPDFGADRVNRLAPDMLLGGGLVLAVMAGALVVSQSRRRDQALQLAATMTEDLNNERNAAVSLRQKDEAILAGIGEGLISFDKHGEVDVVNAAAMRILGFTESELTGKQFTTSLRAEDESGKEIPQEHRPVTYALERHKIIQSALYYRRKNGERFPVQLTVAPLLREGEVIGAIEIFRDASKEQALDKAKNEFVSLASHQLRTPLSAINWYSEMLLGGDAGKLNKAQQEYLQEIFDGNQRMVELVDSLLNVSRLEVGKIKNDAQDTSMLELTDSLAKELHAGIASKQMVYERQQPTSLPPVFADPKLLRMIVQNLLSNAIKYTPEKGKVTLVMREATAKDVTKAKLSTDPKYLFISVSDTGYGIPKAQQDKIFQKLFRADNVRKLDMEGTGLGLYILKEVVGLLGGAVWFESTESVGTTFYVIIPFKTKPT